MDREKVLSFLKKAYETGIKIYSDVKKLKNSIKNIESVDEAILLLESVRDVFSNFKTQYKFYKQLFMNRNIEGVSGSEDVDELNSFVKKDDKLIDEISNLINDTANEIKQKAKTGGAIDWSNIGIAFGVSVISSIAVEGIKYLFSDKKKR